MEKIDVREIRLGKWHIPKSQSIGSIEGDSDGAFHAIGYFDLLEVREIKIDEHPLSDAYKNSYRVLSEEKLGYSVQDIKAFTNVIDEVDTAPSSDMGRKQGFTKQQIEKFWEKNSLVLCVSMVHFDLGQSVKEVTDKICDVFKGRDFLYYITFDYSGIVILAKDISVEEYQKCLFDLNYLQVENTLVRDTFSVFSIDREGILYLFDRYARGDMDASKCYVKDISKYLITVNISIKDYRLFKKFQEELRTFEEQNHYSSEIKRMLGRHDVSIVNTMGDLLWLTYVQYLLDKYSSCEDNGFWAYESFIKTNHNGTGEETFGKTSEPENAWKQANANLEIIYTNFCQLMSENNYGMYRVPVREVKESILSILKNGFAEDFILCMYQSFVEFLQYLGGKIKEETEHPDSSIRYREEFDDCFSKYFNCLNALVNSAMHSERQFIQATAFNAIIYDVPPKIMAFYTAMVYDIEKIIRSERDRKYTFILTPGFSNEISVEIISYTERTVPKDRILKVSINEQSLYNPQAVIRRMSHEIAHYVGDEFRNRDIRKGCVLKSLISLAIFEILDKDMGIFQDKKVFGLIDELCEYAKTWPTLGCSETCYFDELTGFGVSVLKFLHRDKDAYDKIYQYVEGKIDTLKETKYVDSLCQNSKGSFYRPNLAGDLSIFDRDYLCRRILEDIGGRIQKLILDIESPLGSLGRNGRRENRYLKNSNMNAYMSNLRSLYTETYADLQMILLLNITYEDYLIGFIQDEEIDVEGFLKNDSDIHRIAVISKLMQDVGIWKRPDGNDTFESEKMKSLDGSIRQKQRDMNVLGDLGEVENIVEEVKEVLYDNYCSEEPLWKVCSEINIYSGDRYIANAFSNIQLYRYLCYCLRDSVNHFIGKYKEVISVRENVKIISEFQDVYKVYGRICSVIVGYREKINSNEVKFYKLV